MISKLKQWYRSKTDAIKFWLMLRWTSDRGLSIVQIVTIEGVDFIATSNGTFREISKTDFILRPEGEIDGPTNAANECPVTGSRSPD